MCNLTKNKIRKTNYHAYGKGKNNMNADESMD